MTSERDFNAIARAWLDESPREAPDRVIVAVLEAVESTPQERRAMRWLIRRAPTLNRLMLAAAVAAAIAIAVGGGTLFLNSIQPPSNVGSSPSPSASAAVSPDASASPEAGVPPELRYAWLGDVRDVAGLETDRSILEFTESRATYAELLHSDVSSPGPGQLTLTVRTSVAGCSVGDLGTYRMTLSPGGTQLSLEPLDDACTSRSEALAGDWLRSDCRNPDNLCLGPLEVGSYASFFFAPRLPVGATWAPEFGALRYTVPEGWAATSDYPREYFLEPIEWYESAEHDFARATRGIYVASHVVPFEPAGRCAPAIASDADLEPGALAAWVASHPGLDAGEPQDISIGGYTGTMVDARSVADWDGLCTAAPKPVAALFGEAGGDASDRVWGALVGEPNRFIFLDIGEEHPVLVNISAPEDRFDTLLPEAMQIVESLSFE